VIVSGSRHQLADLGCVAQRGKQPLCGGLRSNRRTSSKKLAVFGWRSDEAAGMLWAGFSARTGVRCDIVTLPGNLHFSTRGRPCQPSKR